MISKTINQIQEKELNFQNIKQAHDGESALMISNARLLIADRIEALTNWSTDTEVNVAIECVKSGPNNIPTFFIGVMHLEGSTYEILPSSEFSIYSISTKTSGKIDDSLVKLTITYQYNQQQIKEN